MRVSHSSDGLNAVWLSIMPLEANCAKVSQSMLCFQSPKYDVSTQAVHRKKQTMDGHISVVLVVKCIFALFSTARLSFLGRFQI